MSLQSEDNIITDEFLKEEQEEVGKTLENRRRDWSELSSDLLCEILRRLSVVGHLRFSAVCHPWQSAAQERRHLPALRPPWLLMPHPDNPQQLVNFLSLSLSREKFTVRLPIDDFKDRNIVGSTCGWLVTTTCLGRVFMLNPLTGKEIELPSITTFPDLKCVGFFLFMFDPALHGGSPSYKPDCWVIRNLSWAYIKKAIVIPACSTQSSTLACEYTVVAIVLNYRLAVFRSSDNKWIVVRPPEYKAFQDIASIDGVVYALDLHGRLFTLDILADTLEEICFEHPNTFRHNTLNLVVSAHGNILLVERDFEFHRFEKNYVTTRVEVYKLDLDSKSWVEVNNLGHYCLFVGLNQGLLFSTLDFPELEDNIIYFTDTSRDPDIEYRQDMGLFDLERQMFEPIDGYDEELMCPRPLWFSPSLFDVEWSNK